MNFFNLEWIIFRFTILLVFFGFLFDLEIIIALWGFLIFHIGLGLKTIISDYIHIKKIMFVSHILIRISLIEVLRYTLDLFI